MGFLLSWLLIGCSPSNNATSTQTIISQSEEASAESSSETKAEESESPKDNNSKSIQKDNEKTSSLEETSAKKTETKPEMTAFIPDFKDKTLALECQDTIELPDRLKHISFSSAQPEIVSVDEHGTLTALALGTADITM